LIAKATKKCNFGFTNIEVSFVIILETVQNYYTEKLLLLNETNNGFKIVA